MSVSFSLKKAQPTTSAATGSAPSLKKRTAFASFDDDEPIDAAPTASSSTTKATGVNRALANQASKLSRAQQKVAEEAKRVDSTVFEYDEVWDTMQAAKARQKQKQEVEAAERKPKYIGSLLQSATVRKLDHLRAEEKMIQREREAEGDEFADKEQFVTQAYKDQMAEVRKAEEEEKKREEMEKSKRKQSSGMTHFYRQLLEQSEAEHSATVAATQEASNPNPRKRGPLGPENLTIMKPDDLPPPPSTDAEKVKLARADGKEVEVNDDGQIVDSRELLSAGLNLSAPNTRKLGLTLKKKTAADGGEPIITHRAVGSAASQREINERRRREIQAQLAEEKERTRKELEERERESIARNVTKRNTADDVQSAKARYLERKRRKLEEAAQSGPEQT